MKKPAEFKWGKLSPKQSAVMRWWLDPVYKDCEGIILDGAIRSGKTVSMGFSFVDWAMYTFNGQNLGMSGKTIESLRRNVIVTLKRQLKAQKYNVTERRSENLMIVSKNGVTNTFYLFGGKDERSQDLIQGITLAGMLFDEVALMPQSFVNQATARCSVTGSKFWFNCNPASPKHWFKTEWIDKWKERNLLYFHFTMADNFTLSDAIRRRYEGMYTGVFYKRYILGLWCLAEGLIYDMFDEKVHVTDEWLSKEEMQEYYISSDFGIQNATTFVLWAKKRSTGQWVSFNEYYYSGRANHSQKTVSELVDGLEKIMPRDIDDDGNEYIIQPESIIVDPSAAALIAELRKRDYSVRKGNNDVLDGITDVSTMLRQNKLLIHRICKNTIREFGIYAWDSKAADRGEDVPVKVEDHCMDAVRYFVKTMHLVRVLGYE